MWLNNQNFKDYLKGITVVEVSGESCANCLSLMPILHRLLNNRDDVKLYHIEVASNTMELINKLDVQTVPTILVMYNDIVVARCRGYQPEEILEIWLDAKIEEVKEKYLND